MAKRVDVSSELLASLEEASEILAGRREAARSWNPPAAVDVRAIRARTRLSQTAFAHRFGFTAGAVRDWEQGRRHPEAAARVLLMVIDKHPDVVAEVLVAA